jgi:hypothetical protein
LGPSLTGRGALDATKGLGVILLSEHPVRHISIVTITSKMAVAGWIFVIINALLFLI